MISRKACKECCIDQIKRLAVLLNTDSAHILESFEKEFEATEGKTAPEYAEFIFKAFNEKTGIDDPYKTIKDESNKEALRLLPLVEETLNKKLSGLQKLIEMAIVGNVIDYGAFREVRIEEFINDVLSAKYFKFDIEDFEKDMDKAKKVLYIADNAGEIIFDTPFIKEICERGKKVYLAVREGPIINDATYDDAVFAGLHNLAEIKKTGTRIPGIITKLCSKDFIKTLYDVDMVISKGQGNFETLYVEEHKPKNLYYLFVVKCKVVADLLGTKIKDKVLMKSR